MSEKQSSKQPFMPLFFGDFLAATSEWEGLERSLYLTLLAFQWSQGSLPTEPRKLARLVDWERDTFELCWRQVSRKFVEIDGRLYNQRLELHRARTRELSAKNAEAGKKGAAAKWRKDGERHSAGMADASGKDDERHTGQMANVSATDGAAMANATGKDGERQSSAMAIHPIPSLSNLSDTSHPSGARHIDAQAGIRQSWNPAQIREAFQIAKATYPVGTYRQNTWLSAERNFARLIDDGQATPHQLIEAVTMYGEQQAAAGKVGSQFVLGPGKFFEPRDGHWRGPFPKSTTKAEARQAATIAAGREWLNGNSGE